MLGPHPGVAGRFDVGQDLNHAAIQKLQFPFLGFLTSMGYFFIGSTSECPGYACGCLGPYDKVRVDQTLVDVLVFYMI